VSWTEETEVSAIFLKYRLYNCANVLQDEFNEEIQEHNS
jgi:hypothetical protein